MDGTFLLRPNPMENPQVKNPGTRESKDLMVLFVGYQGTVGRYLTSPCLILSYDGIQVCGIIVDTAY